MRRSNLPIYVDALYLFYSLTYYAFAMFLLRAGLLGELCRKTEREKQNEGWVGMGNFDWFLGTKEERERYKEINKKIKKTISAARKAAHIWWKYNLSLDKIPCSKCQGSIYRFEGCILLPWQDTGLKELEEGTEELIIKEDHYYYEVQYSFKVKRPPDAMLYKQPICVRCAENILSECLLKKTDKAEGAAKRPISGLSNLRKVEEKIKKEVK